MLHTTPNTLPREWHIMGDLSRGCELNDDQIAFLNKGVEPFSTGSLLCIVTSLKTPSFVLQQLARASNLHSVISEIIQNPNTNETTLRNILFDNNVNVRIKTALVYNKLTTVEMTRYLINVYPSTCIDVSMFTMHEEIVCLLSKNALTAVRVGVAGNAFCSDEIREVLSNDVEAEVRHTVTRGNTWIKFER